jgi:GNAT superfamily N-acetyltransferase
MKGTTEEKTYKVKGISGKIIYHVDDEKIQVDLLSVPKTRRGKGCGRTLMENFLKEFQGTSLYLVALPKERSIDMDCLVSFYESLGFSPSDDECGDGVLMEK